MSGQIYVLLHNQPCQRFEIWKRNPDSPIYSKKVADMGGPLADALIVLKALEAQ